MASLPALSHKVLHLWPKLLDKARHAMLHSKSGHVLRDLEVLAVQQHRLTGRLTAALGVRYRARAPHAVELVHPHDV